MGGARVLAEYRAPPGPYAAGHRGIDLTALGGIARSPSEGVVVFAGVVGDRPLVVVDHPDGYRSTLEPVSPSVAAGDVVAAGHPLGAVVTGGHCPAGCLHFGVRHDGEYVNPRALVGGIPRAVLLPLVRDG
ncbi:MAG: M23 family metallopeptidase [Herbiconiux sp.]|nr:M23 family metallopeptidase [Herbiconiux sp.]